MVTKGDTMVTKGDNVTKAARAQSAVTSRTVISTRVRPATARIRYQSHANRPTVVLYIIDNDMTLYIKFYAE